DHPGSGAGGSFGRNAVSVLPVQADPPLRGAGSTWGKGGRSGGERLSRVSGCYGQGAGCGSGGGVRKCETRAHGYIDSAVYGGLGTGRCGADAKGVETWTASA